MPKNEALGQKGLDSRRSHLTHHELHLEMHQELHNTKILRSPPPLLTDRGKLAKHKEGGLDQ